MPHGHRLWQCRSGRPGVQITVTVLQVETGSGAKAQAAGGSLQMSAGGSCFAETKMACNVDTKYITLLNKNNVENISLLYCRNVNVNEKKQNNADIHTVGVTFIEDSTGVLYINVGIRIQAWPKTIKGRANTYARDKRTDIVSIIPIGLCKSNYVDSVFY